MTKEGWAISIARLARNWFSLHLTWDAVESVTLAHVTCSCWVSQARWSEVIFQRLSIGNWKRFLFSFDKWNEIDRTFPIVLIAYSAKCGRQDGLKKGTYKRVPAENKKERNRNCDLVELLFWKILSSDLFSRTNNARNGIRLVIRFKFSVPGFVDPWLSRVYRIEMIYPERRKNYLECKTECRGRESEFRI